MLNLTVFLGSITHTSYQPVRPLLFSRFKHVYILFNFVM